MNNKNVEIFDFHIHSRYSYDSINSIEKIITTAHRKGFTGIAITDHNTIRGAIEAQKYKLPKGFQVILGTEISTELGDIIGLFITQEITSRDSYKVIEEIHTQGGLVVLPHPFKHHILTDELLKAVDVIEISNSRTEQKLNQKATELALHWKKVGIAGSDAHCIGEIGLSKNVFTNVSNENLKKAIMYNAIQISQAKSPRIYEVQSQMYKMIKTKRLPNIRKVFSWVFSK